MYHINHGTKCRMNIHWSHLQFLSKLGAEVWILQLLIQGKKTTGVSMKIRMKLCNILAGIFDILLDLV